MRKSSALTARANEGRAMADIQGFPNVNNYLVGTDEADHIVGNTWHDYIVGGAGDDHLEGGWGKDHIDGGPGNDAIKGGAAVDVLTGGCGDDTFIFNIGVNKETYGPGNVGRDIITDFSCGDHGEVYHSGELAWDSAKAEVINTADNTVLAHLNGHEGDTVEFAHVGNHWDFFLA
jgi:Ca2+-binding RTX toxin-like protein